MRRVLRANRTLQTLQHHCNFDCDFWVGLGTLDAQIVAISNLTRKRFEIAAIRITAFSCNFYPHSQQI